jgi:hypothetical protein
MVSENARSASISRPSPATGISMRSRGCSRPTPSCICPCGALAVYDCVDAIGYFLTDYSGTWEERHHVIEEIVDLGQGVVLVVVWEDGCAQGSKARVQARHGFVWQFG